MQDLDERLRKASSDREEVYPLRRSAFFPSTS